MNEWGFVWKIKKTFEQGRLIFSYAGGTSAILHTSEKSYRAAKTWLFFCFDFVIKKKYSLHIYL